MSDLPQLYRLKSNPKTIVTIKGGFTKVFWSDSMESYCYNAQWMLHRLNEENLIPLSDEEAEQVRAKEAEFKTRYLNNRRLTH